MAFSSWHSLQCEVMFSVFSLDECISFPRLLHSPSCPKDHICFIHCILSF
jgi:hypothetical protein